MSHFIISTTQTKWVKHITQGWRSFICSILLMHGRRMQWRFYSIRMQYTHEIQHILYQLSITNSLTNFTLCIYDKNISFYWCFGYISLIIMYAMVFFIISYGYCSSKLSLIFCYNCPFIDPRLFSISLIICWLFSLVIMFLQLCGIIC